MMSFNRISGDIIATTKVIIPIKATERQLRHALFEVGNYYKRSANKAILNKAAKTGRIYIVRSRTGRKRKHRSSARGQSHANLTGELRRSIGWKVSGSKRLLFGYGITADAPVYAHAVEITMNRPSLANAVKAERRNTMNAIERAARKTFNP